MTPAAIEKAEALVKGFEGLRLEAYQDVAGVWTIGYGHIRGVKKGGTCTAEEAEAFFDQDMAPVLRALDPVAQRFALGVNESAALISLAFNEGAYAVIKPNLSIYQALAKGTKGDVAKAIALWCKATVNGVKVVVEGLANRRAKEAELFLTPDTP